jgi:hypothetical protein
MPQYQVLYEKAKADLFSNPIMARHKDKPRDWHKGAIEKRMLDELSAPMDLAKIPDPGTD